MAWAIYFVGLVDGLRVLGIVSSVLGCLGAVVGAVIFVVAKNECDDPLALGGRMCMKICIPILVAGVLLGTFTPSSRTLAAMIILPRLAENEQVQNITGNSLRALEKLTAEWAAETVLDVKAEEVTP